MAILGPGLIGGSLFLALRTQAQVASLRIWGRRKEALDELASLSAAQDSSHRELAPVFVSTDLPAVVEGSHGIVLCSPVASMEQLAHQMLPYLGACQWITDVGSVKGELVYRLEAILGKRFVGAHPMAGSEKVGFANARADLFAGATCILTPTLQTDPASLAATRAFWLSVGCKILLCDPIAHDRAVARISHLPHMVAAALALTAGQECQQFAGPGYRDSTRIAMGPPEMWASILIENRLSLLDSLDALSSRLGLLRDAIASAEADALVALLHEAADLRASLP